MSWQLQDAKARLSKERHRAERDAWHPNLILRVHRALSWLDRAEQLGGQDDADGQFILLWIAFNAAYATEIDEKYRDSEQQTFRGFLDKLTQLDAASRRFEAPVWTEFPNSIRVLLDNPYVFADFWKFRNGTLPEPAWKASFAAANKAAHVALGRQDTVTVLSIVPSRVGRQARCRNLRTLFARVAGDGADPLPDDDVGAAGS